jgi:hypothetical protein
LIFRVLQLPLSLAHIGLVLNYGRGICGELECCPLGVSAVVIHRPMDHSSWPVIFSSGATGLAASIMPEKEVCSPVNRPGSKVGSGQTPQPWSAQ